MITIREHVPLKDHTTFRTGGPARFFCEVTSENELIEALRVAHEKNVRVYILGGGSNILAADEGFDGMIVKMRLNGVVFGDTCRVRACAGEDWDTFVGMTIEKGLQGLENLSLIPGTVGACPVQNIGAYGVEVKDAIESVEVIDRATFEKKIIPASECGFAYRTSIFKRQHNPYIIVAVNFVLHEFDFNDAMKRGFLKTEYKDIKEYCTEKGIDRISMTPADIREAVIAIRRKKLPDVTQVGTAGSFFKNPVISKEKYAELVANAKYAGLPKFDLEAGDLRGATHVKVPLAWILDNVCGYKGHRSGAVGVYGQQALVLVNYGGGTAADIMALAREMTAAVLTATGIEIEPEVCLLS